MHSKLAKLFVSMLLSFAVAAIGSLATFSNIPTWYATLAKPFFSPPNWVFGPVWTILYLLMGASLYVVWIAKYKKSKRHAFIAFVVQLALNALWSLIFFGLHAPWGGVVTILALLTTILVTMRLFWLISKPAAYLLVPYVLWVTFATLLNISIARLNQ